MTYGVPQDSHGVAQDVAIFARVYYVTEANSCLIAYDLYLPVWWDLKKNTGASATVLPHLSSIGDLEITIREVPPAPTTGGVTGYEVTHDTIASQGGNSLLLEIIGQHLLPFAKATLKASVLNPFFAPILSVVATAVFRRIGTTDGDKAPFGSLRLLSLPWWGLKVWNDSPGTLPLRLKIGYVTDGSIQNTTSYRPSGTVTYEATVSAETGGLIGGLRKTGVLTIPPMRFIITWS